jgi:hypothetical protein
MAYLTFPVLVLTRKFVMRFAIFLIKKSILKGTVSRDFRPLVFSSNNPIWPLIHGLKPVRMWLRIREVIRQSRCLSGVMGTAVANTAVLAMPTWFKITKSQWCH